MRQRCTAIISTALILMSCNAAIATEASSAALSQAKTDLQAAKAIEGEWRISDKATGKEPEKLSKLLDAAEKKAAEGDTEEAERIAKKVSDFAKRGADQATTYKGALPYYN